MAGYIRANAKDFTIWTGPKHGEDNGIELIPSGYLFYAIFQVKSFPDLSLNKDLTKFDFQQRDKIVYGYQQKFVDTLHKIGNEKTSFTLRYILDPNQPFENKINLFLIVRTISEKEDDSSFLHIVRQIPNIFPTEMGLYHAPVLINDTQAQMKILTTAKNMTYIAEIRKKEKVFIPYKEIPKLKYVYIPFNFAPQLNTMIPVCETMVKQIEPVLLDIDIIPTYLTAYEQHALKTLVINFDKLQREQRITEKTKSSRDEEELVELPADPIIKLAFETYKNNLNEYSTSGVFLLGCRVASNNIAAVESIITVMGRNSARDFDYEMLLPENAEELESSRKGILHCDISTATYNNDIWDRPDAPAVVRRLHRLCSTSEANSFFALPIPSVQGVPGFPITSRPQDMSVGENEHKKWYDDHHALSRKEQVIVLGNIGLRGERLREDLSIKLKDLAKHGLIVGVPGSGKTTTCFHILYQLWTIHRIPFLVIEPAKTEYRALKTLPGMDDLLIFTIGDENCSPFRFNPFEIFPDVSLEKHISNIEACFRGALPLDGPLPFILSEALECVYNDNGWQFMDIGSSERNRWPMLIDLYQKLIEVINQKGYSGEVLSNVRTALEIRVGGLLRRSVGRMLNSFFSIPPKIAMSRPVVLELDSLNDEQQALMTMFILNMVKEYVRATRKSGANLQHMILLEEAHNLLGHVSPIHDAGNPKAEAVKYFIKMLAEMRALGEGIIVADQLPSALNSAVIKNTNLKIMHRLTSEDDRKQLGATMLLDEEQFIKAVTLTPGESYIYKEGLERPKHVFEPNFKDDFMISEPPDDVYIRNVMGVFREEHSAIFMPYIECSMCCDQCNYDYRLKAETILNEYAGSTKLHETILKELESNKIKCSCYHIFNLLLAKPRFLVDSKDPKLMTFCLYVNFLHKMKKLIKQGSRITRCNCHDSKRKQVFEIIWTANSRRLTEGV